MAAKKLVDFNSAKFSLIFCFLLFFYYFIIYHIYYLYYIIVVILCFLLQITLEQHLWCT